jgi:signal transduction histidine kinase
LTEVATLLPFLVVTTSGHASRPPSLVRPAWQRYGAALGLTALVIGGRRLLDPVWGQTHNRHLVFLPTVMLAAWLGGFGPGATSAALATLALGLLWPGAGREGMLELGLFFAIGLAVSALIQSLHGAREREEAAKRAREHLLAIVAHDLRNPLSSIKLAGLGIERAKAGEAGEGVRRSTAVILRAVSRMDRLIGDLIDSTRIEHGGLVIHVEDEPVGPIVTELVETFAALAQDKGVALHAPLPPADLAVRADHDRLLQVIGNLVSNALRFTPEGGRIELRARGRERDVLFEVQDTGPGIAAEQRRTIFDRFGRSDGGGIGLGLFIARSIVHAHGGELDVRSEPGSGATFFFTIPRASAVRVDVVQPRTPSEPPPARNGTDGGAV